MEIGKKILELRKKKGLSQEELAEKVGVTRQTISKWELSETYPDLNQAKNLSQVFNVSLDELVSNDIKDVLIEKTSNTEKLAGLILTLLKIGFVLIIVLPILLIVSSVTFKNIREKNSGRLISTSINCVLHDEEYNYEFVYYENTAQIKEAGGDGYLSNILDIDRFDNAYQALDIIDAYVKNNGGTCKKVDNGEYKEN